MRFFKTSFALAALLFLMASCDDGKQSFNETVTVNPNDPIGSVGGVIFDAATDAPLENVQVTLIVGDYTATTTTDATGVYSFSNVPATGSALLLFTAGGYLNARETAMFSESEGSATYGSPTATARPVWMVKTGHSLRVRVVDAKGQPVPNVELTLRMNQSWYVLDANALLGMGEFHTTANTNLLGLADFTGLPIPGQIGDANFNTAYIYVPDVDIDNDGYADYTSNYRSIDIRYNSGTVETITLYEENGSNLAVTGSNIPYFLGGSNFPGAFNPGDTIFVSFNKPPVEEDLTVTLYQNAENSALSWPILPTLNGNLLSFDLPDDVVVGEKYFIHVYAHTADNGSFYQRAVPVFIKGEEEITIVSIAKNDPLQPNSPITIEFNQYVGTGNSSYTDLFGTNGVVFMNWDYDASGTTGDALGENGFYSTNIHFYIDETSPNWVPGYSSGLLGFSKKWIMSGYDSPTLPSVGTIINLNFDNSVSSSYRMRTPDGAICPNLSENLP